MNMREGNRSLRILIPVTKRIEFQKSGRKISKAKYLDNIRKDQKGSFKGREVDC